MSDDTDQGESQSVTDRIASKFGFPGQEEAAEQATEGTESDLAEVEWEGAKYKLPSKLKDALMRNEDYTRKTQDLAEQRRAVDHARELAIQRSLDASFADSVSAEQQQMSVIDAYLGQVAKLDWATMNTDQMLRQKVEIDNLKEQRQTLKEAIDGKRGRFKEEVTAKMNELRGKSREMASKSIQGFGEDTEKSVRSYGLTEGLTESEIDSILLDPRSFKLMWKAMQFERVQAGTGKAEEAAKKVDRVLKPGGAGERMPQNVREKLDYGKAIKGAKTSGEKARVIESRLAGVFERSHTQ